MEYSYSYVLFFFLREKSNPRELEKIEEEKLKAKYPTSGGMRGPGGHSAFLQKRLQKGVSSTQRLAISRNSIPRG